MSESIYAVLSGDLVASSRFGTVELHRVLELLRKGADLINQRYPDLIVGGLDIYSGDGWQLLIAQPELSIRAALVMRAFARSDRDLKPDTRIAMGWGCIEEESLDLKHISRSIGEAFVISGRLLSGLKKPFRLSIDVSNTLAERISDRYLRSTVTLFDQISGGWTAAQAEVIGYALLGHTQVDIADMLKIQQPTVQNTLASAGWPAVLESLSNVEYSQIGL